MSFRPGRRAVVQRTAVHGRKPAAGRGVAGQDAQDLFKMAVVTHMPAALGDAAAEHEVAIAPVNGELTGGLRPKAPGLDTVGIRRHVHSGDARRCLPQRGLLSRRAEVRRLQKQQPHGELAGISRHHFAQLRETRA
jgi:hypothetical protein